MTQAAQDAVRALESVPEGVELAQAYANLGACALISGRDLRGARLLRAGTGRRERLGRPEVQSYALNAIGLGLVYAGRDGLGTIEDALRLALDADLQEHAGRAHSSLVEAAVVQQRFDLADRYYADGMAYSDEHELGVFALCMDGWRAGALLLTGRWDEAADVSRRLLGRQGISPVNKLNPLRVLGTIAARRGDHETWTLLDQVTEMADRNREPTWIAPVRAARAEAALAGRRSSASRRGD